MSYAEDSFLTLATGSEKGVYYPIGQGICEVAAKQGLYIKMIPSQGSIENIKLLESKQADIALVQSDVAFYAYNGTNIFNRPFHNISAILSLYTESIQILVRNSLWLKKIKDFKGKRVAIGPEGSGTQFNAGAILEAAGITVSEVETFNLDFIVSIQYLERGLIDIAFITAGIPADIIEKAIKNNIARLFPIELTLLRRLIRAYPYFVITNIPSNTYSRQYKEIATLGVRALLLTRNDINKVVIYRLLKAIFEGKETLITKHPKAKDINIESALKGISIPIHIRAKEYFEKEGLYKKRILLKAAKLAIWGIIVILVAFAIQKIHYIHSFFKKRELARIAAVIFGIWIFGSIGLYFAEREVNENFSTILKSLWSGIVYLSSGFENREPITHYGHIISVVMLTLGAATLAVFTATVASIFIEKKLIGGRKMPKSFKNHFAIINWNEKGYGIIEQLHSSDFKEKKPIVVVTESVDEINFPEKIEYEEVYIVKGDPASKAMLKRASISYAHSVIILSDPKLGNLADAKSLVSIMAVGAVCKDEKRVVPHIVVEVVNPQKIELFKDTSVAIGSNIEFVFSSFLGQHLLTQVAVTSGLTKLYEDLLTFTKGSNEIYRIKLPKKFVAKSFEDLAKAFLELRKKNIYAIPIGISRNENVYLNPRKEDLKALEEGDDIYIISDTKIDLENVL